MNPKIFVFCVLVVCATMLLVCERGRAMEQLPPLTAGESITLASGQSVAVPSGTTIFAPDGSKVTVNGHRNVVHTSNGTVVTVSPGATGAADNIVIAK
jgi:hypothetical protein